ncbi:MAG TPA: cyclopropane-fatty-acyl-phospholipid synthase family protein [Candidatus Binatia bacterium]|nr:cyclopropane-fatty-acyl-phospholipid synthase family protein [Candidatus Binatia bacterium]
MTHSAALPMTEPAEPLLVALCERGWLPDGLVRAGMRRLCAQRLRDEQAHEPEACDARLRARVAQWSAGPLAVATREANLQHYEVPPPFFEQVLGPHLKYSCALWQPETATLADAERGMLELTCERAQLRDGQRILELGCGWGSLTLWMARTLPRAQIVAVSNSAPQREWILRRAAERGLRNVEVITADVNDFRPQGAFDRVVSVEMFEHVRNHAELFRRIRGWLAPRGLLFAHVFCHRHAAYPFESEGPTDWMARHFFSGGMMPGYDLFLHYPRDLQIRQRWWLSGEHYQRTSEAWLANLDAHRTAVLEALGGGATRAEARLRVQRWRMFFMAVAELFGYDRGRQWGVGHYQFEAG